LERENKEVEKEKLPYGKIKRGYPERTIQEKEKGNIRTKGSGVLGLSRGNGDAALSLQIRKAKVRGGGHTK